MAEDEETGFELLGFPVAGDSEGLRSRDPLEVLASQFVAELRDGRRPSVDAWARRFPLHADRIREYFPVLAMLEQTRSDSESQTLRKHMPGELPVRSLGGCEILCELGRGGMGVVYQARDLATGQIVAVKVLPWRVSIVPDWRERFEQEARTAARLKHPNIVPVFRFGQEQGYCFFVMQFINGIGLDRLITRLTQTDSVSVTEEIRLQQQSRPASFVAPPDSEAADPGRDRISRHAWQQFLRIAIQAAQALQHAHECGIVHNDVKPGNLLLDSACRLWVTDFGVAQPLNPLAPVTERTAGTVRFMAPERFRRPGDIGSDVYALGMTLYELCVQQPPVGDPELRAGASPVPTPPRPRRICRELPRSLEQVILNCIATDPQCRYPSAQALLTDLLTCAADKPVASLQPGPLTGLIRKLRRSPHPGDSRN